MSIELNPDQLRAAVTLNTSVAVTAGAGSGKTRVLTQRFINAVSPGAVDKWAAADVDQILAITFTEKAAGELAERVRGSLKRARLVDQARRVDSAWVSTIHGLCSRLLRRHALDAGIDPLFTVADTIVLGNLRADAFEHVAVRLLAESGDVATLFDEYPFAAVYAAALQLTRDLGVHGLDPADIDLEEALDAECLLDEALELFSSGCSACATYAGSAKSASEFTERCTQLLERAVELQRDVSGEESLRVLAHLVGAYKPLRVIKGLEEESEESRELGARLLHRVGAALVAPHARALVALAEAFGSRFAEMKRAAGVLDYDDLQILAVQLLESRPAIALRYRERFRLVMVDEFQDTDALQLRLVQALSGDDLCTVGDEKQSIYRFRGAEIGVYREHRNAMRHSGALEVSLGVNYRSHGDVLAFVNAVFSSEEYFAGDLLRLVTPDGQREPQRIDGALEEAPRVEALFVDSSGLARQGCREAEAIEIARRLRELVDSGAAAGDMAILVRAYSSAHVYAEALSGVGLPAVIVGGSRFFGLQETHVMRALTRVIANPADEEALGELLISDLCPISDDGLARLRFCGDGLDREPLWKLLSERRDRLGETDAAAAELLVKLVFYARYALGSRPLSDVLLAAVEDAGWDLRLLAGGNAGRDAFANVLKFARLAETFEAGDSSGPAGFADYLDSKDALGDAEAPASVADDGTQAVRIMSVHASKGLEFPVVVVPDLASRGRGGGSIVRTVAEDGRLRLALTPPPTDDGPTLPKSGWAEDMAALDAEAEAEESDRILYVAFTRARDLLIASGSANLRPKGGSTSKNHLMKLARFLGVQVPIPGTCDVEGLVDDCGRSARVRVRVVDAVEVLETNVADATSDCSQQQRTFPIRAGERFESPIPAHLAPIRISYSRLHTFEQCPQRYFLETVVGFRRADISETGSAGPMRFGSALHAILQLANEGVVPADERMDAVARQFELDNQELARLRAAASSFLSSDTSRRAVSAERTARELAFFVPVASGRCVLDGVIDLYAREGDRALIVDYKSGTSGDERDLRERYALQAACYALAAFTDGAEDVEVVFTRPEVQSHDGAPQEVCFSFGADDKLDLVDRVDGILAAIASSDFARLTRRVPEVCDSCPAPCGVCSNARS